MAERICSIDDCDRDASGKRGGGRGWCSTHYMRWRRHGDPERGGEIIRQAAKGNPCSIDGCRKLTVARVLCENHYRRWKRYGDPLAGRVTPGALTTAERFWAKVNKGTDPDGCWLWTDAPNGNGYGTFRADGRTWGAHQYTLILDGQTIDPTLTVDHLCRVRLCIRPGHLEQVTYAVNLERARLADTG